MAASKPFLAFFMQLWGDCEPASIFDSSVKITVSHSFQAAIFGRRPMLFGCQASKTAFVVSTLGIDDGGLRARSTSGSL